MRFVELKSEAQLDMQSLHRARDRLVGERTALINQLRAFLLEALRFSADPERYTAQEVVGAWQEANAKVNRAMQHLAFVTRAIRTQRDGVVAALETATDHAENHN
jgi:transposase